MSVAARYYDVGRLAGEQAEKILVDGISAGELPVAQMTNFAIVINMDEIGRASCRERVGQSVSISVVAVSLKKKIKNKYSCSLGAQKIIGSNKDTKQQTQTMK